MVHREFSEGTKGKPRGRPFPKGNKQGKLTDDVLDSSGRKSSDEGGAMTSNLQSPAVEEQSTQKSVLHELPTLIDQTIKEAMNTPQEEQATEQVTPDNEIMDSIEFKNGENTLTVRLSKKHNRMFRIQIFLNGDTEFKPMTYAGSSTAYTFWNIFKGSLKK